MHVCRQNQFLKRYISLNVPARMTLAARNITTPKALRCMQMPVMCRDRSESIEITTAI